MFRGFGSWPIGNTVLVGTVHPGYAVDTGAVLQLLSAVEEDTGGARDGYIYICGYDAPPPRELVEERRVWSVGVLTDERDLRDVCWSDH